MNERPPDLLRVASPRARNTQQNGPERASAGATDAQQASLKALAADVLARNKPRTSSAAEAPKHAQQTPPETPPFVALETAHVASLDPEAADRAVAEFYRDLFCGIDTPCAIVTLDPAQTGRAVELGLLTAEAAGDAVVLAYRNERATCLLTVPHERYDGFAILHILERSTSRRGDQ
jgi:hypothetical protein